MYEKGIPMEEYKTITPSRISGYLSGLIDNQVNEVLTLYHQNKVKISDIIQRFNLEEIYIGDFCKHLPAKVCKKYVCPDCLVYSWERPKGRGKYSIPFCPECQTVMYNEYDAATIHSERAIKEAQIKKLDLQPINCRGDTLPFQIITKERFSNLDFESKVFIGAIASNCVSAKIGSVQGWQVKKAKFYPIKDLQNEIMYRLNFINEDVDQVHIEIEKELVNALQNPANLIESTIEERFNLWKKIAHAEVCEIFRKEMQESRFYAHIDEDTDQVLFSLLEDYSVAQICNVIWRSVRKAANEYAKTDNRSYAASSVLKHCLNHVAYKENKKELITDYGRPLYCRQSKVSQYYFDSFLKIGHAGFNKSPSPNYLVA